MQWIPSINEQKQNIRAKRAFLVFRFDKPRLRRLEFVESGALVVVMWSYSIVGVYIYWHEMPSSYKTLFTVLVQASTNFLLRSIYYSGDAIDPATTSLTAGSSLRTTSSRATKSEVSANFA